MIDLDLNRVAVPLDWTEVFGRAAPVDVEIGSGTGRFLLELAAARPERSFLAGKISVFPEGEIGAFGVKRVRYIPQRHECREIFGDRRFGAPAGCDYC